MKRVLLLSISLFFAAMSFAQEAVDKINQAQEALKAQDYAKAYQLFDEAMNNLGDVQVDALINFNIGFAAYRSENIEGAVKYFDKAIEAGINVSKSHEYKAMAYNDKEDYTNAVASFEQAIATAETNLEALYYNAGIAAYRGKLLEKAVDFFGKSAELNYRGETALYYKAVSFRGLGNNEEYKATLIEGAEKFPNEKNITSALANVYVMEGNELYKQGATILSNANQKVNDGAMTTADDAYNAEVEKAKVEFRAAVEILEKAKLLDESNANAQKLIDACSAVL
jgi:tetratricopeptide (TPR) repeat protein